MLREWDMLQKDRIAEYSIAGTKLFDEEMIEYGRSRYGPRGVRQKIHEFSRIFTVSNAITACMIFSV